MPVAWAGRMAVECRGQTMIIVVLASLDVEAEAQLCALQSMTHAHNRVGVDY